MLNPICDFFLLALTIHLDLFALIQLFHYGRKINFMVFTGYQISIQFVCFIKNDGQRQISLLTLINDDILQEHFKCIILLGE